MPSEFTLADRVALKKAAAFIAARIRHRAPTAKAADSFKVYARGQAAFIGTRDPGAIATQWAWRHPLFGNRRHWYGPSKSQVGREHFATNAVAEVADEAQERWANEWLSTVARNSLWLERI